MTTQLTSSTPHSSDSNSSSQLNEQLLIDAWRRFSVYDRSANAAQKRFTFLRNTILRLTVAATTLAVIQSVWKPRLFGAESVQQPLTAVFSLSQPLWVEWLYFFLQISVIAAPIVVSILLAGAIKFDRGVNWILLRASAEAIKREIYRYRAKVGIYKSATRDANLASELRTIGERLMKTEVNRAGLACDEVTVERIAKAGKIAATQGSFHTTDDQFSELNADRYLEWRLIDQLVWYRQKTRTLDTQWQRYQWCVYVLGGVGTFLAAIGFEVWVAVSNAFAAAVVSFLEFRQLDATLTAYNQTASNLENILSWWHSLSEDAKRLPQIFEKLVENTEAVIQAETTSWVQEMRDALAGLYKDEDERAGELEAPLPTEEKNEITTTDSHDRMTANFIGTFTEDIVVEETARADDNAGHGRTLPSNEPTHETDDVIQPVPKV